MPIYEYACTACGETFDRLQRTMSATAAEADRPSCPACASTQTRRSLSLFAVAAESAKAGGGGDDAAPTCGRCGGPPGSCSM